MSFESCLGGCAGSKSAPAAMDQPHPLVAGLPLFPETLHITPATLVAGSADHRLKGSTPRIECLRFCVFVCDPAHT